MMICVNIQYKRFCCLLSLVLLSVWTSSVQAVTCFSSGAELILAVINYVDSGYSATANSSITYGYPIENWCTGNVTDFSLVFAGFTNFNEPLTNWDTAKAQIMGSMFLGATSFNQPLFFDTRRVVDFSSMFKDAKAFNQDILQLWDVTSAIDLSNMFNGASSFDKNLCPWKTQTDTWLQVQDMFKNSKCANKADPDIFANPVTPLCNDCTDTPTIQPTVEPTFEPTREPTLKPGKQPTVKPNKKPTRNPVKKPGKKPTRKPRKRPTKKPNRRPTRKPTISISVKQCVKIIRQQCNCGLVFRGSPCMDFWISVCTSASVVRPPNFAALVRKAYKKKYCKKPPQI